MVSAVPRGTGEMERYAVISVAFPDWATEHRTSQQSSNTRTSRVALIAANAGRQGRQLFNELDARHSWQIDLGNNQSQLMRISCEKLGLFLAIQSRNHLIAYVLQNAAQCLLDDFVAVRNQNSSASELLFFPTNSLHRSPGQEEFV